MTDGVRRVGGQRVGWRLAAHWRSAARQCAAGVVVAAVVPLCLSQVPFGGLPGLLVPAMPADGIAPDLVLPFLVATAPLAGLAVRRSGASAVMAGGLVLIVAGDGLALAALNAGLGAGLSAGLGSGPAGGSTVASTALAILVSVLRGCGAGLALPATAALATGHVVRDGSARQPLSVWWAAVTVASLAVLPGLTRTWPTGDSWRTAFGPIPLLTAVAFAAAVLCRPLTGRADGSTGNSAASRTAYRATNRAAFPPEHRAKLAVLAPPAAALALLAAGAGDRSGRAVAAVAVCEAAGLFLMAAMSSRGFPGRGFAMACALAGFVVAPASAELLSLRAMAAAGDAGNPNALLMAGAIAGAALGAATALGSAAAAPAGPAGPAGPVVGLLLAAAALVVACFAGPFAHTVVLALLAAAVAGGLAAALARPARETTTGGAVVGAVMLVSGMLVGSLTVAAITVQLAPGPVRDLVSAGVPPAAPDGGGAAAARGAATVPTVLVTAYGWWLLAGAAVAVAVAFGRCASRARTAAPARATTSARTAAPSRARTAAAATPARTAAAPDGAATPAGARVARHVARGGRRGGKVRPVSG